MTGLQAFFVPGPLPNLNEIIAAAKGYNGRGFAYKKMKEEWTALVVAQIRLAEIKPMPTCAVTCHWREKNQRRDPDNFTVGVKFILDGLVEAGILDNDGWDQVRSIAHQWAVDKHQPGVYVELRRT